MTETVIPIGRPDAIEALRACAFMTETIERIHTFAGAGVIHLGADWDLLDAIEFVETADRIYWTRHPFQHDLAVYGDGRLVFFDCKRPSDG